MNRTMSDFSGYNPSSEWNSGGEEEAYTYFRKAYEQQMAGNLSEAIMLYKKSLELRETAEAHTFLGWAYSCSNRYDEAIVECKLAIELDPDFGNPYNDIGAYLIEKGEHDEAIAWLEKATVAKRYDSYFYPFYNLGRVWEQKGDWHKALRAYNSAVEHNPSYTLARKASARIQGMMN